MSWGVSVIVGIKLLSKKQRFSETVTERRPVKVKKLALGCQRERRPPCFHLKAIISRIDARSALKAPEIQVSTLSDEKGCVSRQAETETLIISHRIQGFCIFI